MALSGDEQTVLSEMDKIQFLQRLKQLQNLCSGRSPNYPRALLCVPGPDGRANKGSLMILKYLFQLSVGKELFEGNLDDRLEALEEMIMLVQEHSISIIVTAEAKNVLSPFLSICPLVSVYCSLGDVPEEVDEFQARKAATFKKLMLQSVAQGGVVGLPVPLGYDSVLDIENWSLMRSFAMESVVAGVRFFTAHFTVIDVSEALEILFRAVDSSVVSKIIEVIKNSIVPNVHQSLRILSGRGAVENRMLITAQDVLSPLDFLFDFGELEAVHPPDPLLKSMALFGQLSNSIGSIPDHVKLAAPWKAATMPPGGVHVIVEGCEPSTGVRWCRTYFTQRGRHVPRISDPDTLVGSATTIDGKPNLVVAADIKRLETLYTLLWEGLRAAVRSVFGGIDSSGVLHPSIDVVTAGADVEKFVEDFLCRRLSAGLKAGEILRIHMDCINGIGQLCKVEDVEDIGGQCLAYLRVSIHGIQTSGLTQPVAVAVGDTFLFSPHSSQVRTLLVVADSADVGVDSAFLKHMQDPFCFTNVIPYVHGIFGIGAEDASAQRLLHALGSPHLLSLMRLGEAVEAHGSSSSYTFPLLTDHTSCPYYQQAELSFFDGGFVFERLNGVMLPGVITFETHVEAMWSVDMSDVLDEAQANLCGSFSRNWLAIPEGLVVILKLKVFPTRGSDGEKSGDSADAPNEILNGNPFDAFLPEDGRVNHVAFLVRSDIQSSAGYYSRAAARWKRAIRTNEIPEYRGRGGASPALPVGILSSFLALYDYWGTMSGSGSSGAQDIMSTASIPKNLYEEDMGCAVEDIFSSASGPLTVPGAGFLPLKSLFNVCENARIYTAECEMLKCADLMPGSYSNTQPKIGRVKIVAVVGHIGSTAIEVAAALSARLPLGSTNVVADCSKLSADQCHHIAADLGGRLCSAAKDISPTGSVLLSVIVPIMLAGDLPLFLEQCITEASSKSGIIFEIVCTVSVVASFHIAPSRTLQPVTNTEEHHFTDSRIGAELFAASVLSLCRIGVCDLIICTDSTVQGRGFTFLRRHVRELAASAVASDSFVGELPLFRLRSPVLRLEDEVIDLILSKFSDENDSARKYSRRLFQVTNLTNLSLSHPFTRIAEIELSDEGEDISRWLAPRPIKIETLPQITGFITGDLTQVPEWSDRSKDRDLDMVLKCLRVLFPKATLSSTAVNLDIWSAPPPDEAHPIGSVRRAMQLATSKVVLGKQLKANRERICTHLARKVDPAMLKQVQGQHLSISGHLVLSGGTVLGTSSNVTIFGHKTVVLDACAEFISMRVVDDFEFEHSESTSRSCGRLVACGTLNSKEFTFIDDLFSNSFLKPLERREHISFGDLTDLELSQIQQSCSHVELPGGHWFDGNVYLDMSGNRSKLRPDIRALSEEYITKRNAQCDTYNKLIYEGI